MINKVVKNWNSIEDVEGEDWFDPSKPTFLFKINVSGLSRQRAMSEVSHLCESYQTKNANMIFIPVGSNDTSASSNVECIHGGSNSKESFLLENLIEETLNLDNSLVEEAELTGKFSEEQLIELKAIIRRQKIKCILGSNKSD